MRHKGLKVNVINEVIVMYRLVVIDSPMLDCLGTADVSMCSVHVC